MSTRDEERERIALLQGTLDLLILRTLVLGPRHGHGIARAIEQGSQDALLVDHGSLYPALQRRARERGTRAGGATPENTRRPCSSEPPPGGRPGLPQGGSRGRALVS